MSYKSQLIGALQLNPYVRYANALIGATSENHTVPWRVIYDFELIFVVKGRISVERANRKYEIAEGQLHIMPPFIKHRRFVPAGETVDYYSVHLDFLYDENNPDFSVREVYQDPCKTGANKIAARPDLMGRQNYKLDVLDFVENYAVADREGFADLFKKVYENFEEKGVCATIKAKAYTMLIIAKYLEELNVKDSAQADKSDYCARFIDYTMNHYSEHIDLDEVIKQYCISPSQFRMIFKSQTDKAPLEYIIDYRIEQAKKLLKSGNYSTTQISFMVGYDDMHYFSRLFKQKTGLSPTEYAKKFTENDAPI